jgi:hypothetical protein
VPMAVSRNVPTVPFGGQQAQDVSQAAVWGVILAPGVESSRRFEALKIPLGSEALRLSGVPGVKSSSELEVLTLRS